MTLTQFSNLSFEKNQSYFWVQTKSLLGGFSPNTSLEVQEVLSQVVEAANKAVAEVFSKKDNTMNIVAYNNFEQSEEYKLLKKLAIEFLSLVKVKLPDLNHKVVMNLDQNLEYTIYVCFDDDQLADYYKTGWSSFVSEELEAKGKFKDQSILNVWKCNLKVRSISDVPYLDRIDIRDEEGELVSYINTNFLKTIFFDI